MNLNIRRIVLLLAMVGVAGTVSNCRIKKENSDADTASATEEAPLQMSTEVVESTEAADVAESESADTADSGTVNEAMAEENSIAAEVTEKESDSTPIHADKIPYPIYPNSSPYRVGDENGMTVVLFETVDTFEEVDAYYQSQAADQEAMPRLSAMDDYVRYASDAADSDPWATDRPGIVIHQFNSESERAAVGASNLATTNIIMSFK